MLDNVSDYIKNIAFFLIFTSFIGIILPDGKYKKYIDIVLGLILIIMTLEPMAAFVFGSSRSFEKILNEITTSLDYEMIVNGPESDTREQLIKESFGQRIKPQLETLAAGFEYTLKDMDFLVDIETGEMISLTLYISKMSAKPTPVPFIRIEKVRVQNNASNVETAETIESGEINELKKSVADFYSMPLDNIHINMDSRT